MGIYILYLVSIIRQRYIDIVITNLEITKILNFCQYLGLVRCNLVTRELSGSEWWRVVGGGGMILKGPIIALFCKTTSTIYNTTICYCLHLSSNLSQPKLKITYV